RTVQRGIVALVIAGSLSIAGPRPAAAMDLGLTHQISRLWSFFIGTPSPASHRTTAGKPDTRKTATGATTGSTTDSSAPSTSDPGTDRGWGIDPNG
ncbi:MAG TPA: hypothetical protein VII86_12040, partial [Thermoanaerobaculia bacterium]